MGLAGGTPMSPGMSQMEQAFSQTAESPMVENEATYPDICYRLAPYIAKAGDMMAAYGMDMPTQQQLEEMADGIFEEFTAANPDMADYMGRSSSQVAADPPPFRGGFRPMFGFRRRGIGRDLIEALLLAELFGRGGFIF